MRNFIFIFLTLIITSCNSGIKEVQYEVKFKDGSFIYVMGYDVYSNKKCGKMEIWSIDGDHVFNYDEVIYIIKTDNDYERKGYRSN